MQRVGLRPHRLWSRGGLFPVHATLLKNRPSVAGIDHAFTNKLIGRLELLYDDYGSKSYGGPEPFTASLTATTLRAALIYKFGNT